MIFRDPFTVLDGGLSTALETLGHPPRGALWTAAYVRDDPAIIVAAHRLAVDAGAEVLISAAYQAPDELLATTTALARQAGAPLVAASIGPFGAMLHDRSEYHGRYAAPWDDVRAFHRRRIRLLAESEPDVFAIETMPGAREAAIAVEALAEASAIPAWVSFTCPDAVHTGYGDGFADAVAAVDHPQVIAVGVNCTSPAHVAGLLRVAATAKPLVAYPNAGPVTPHALEWASLGARLIGGCCGVAPEEISALRRVRDGGIGSIA
jgi:homocysteine S-methyltransferase